MMQSTPIRLFLICATLVLFLVFVVTMFIADRRDRVRKSEPDSLTNALYATSGFALGFSVAAFFAFLIALMSD